MKFIITDVETGQKFIGSDQNSRTVIVTDPSKAKKYTTESKAENMIAHSMRLSERTKWYVVVYEAQKTSAGAPKICDEYIRGLMRFGNQLRNHKDAMENQLSLVDMEISDILHFIELKNFNASQGYKLAKMLKDCCEKRRIIKDELWRIVILSESSIKTHSDGTMFKRLDEMDNRAYRPRVLKELFA